MPPKSTVWQYFIKTQTGGKCKICQQEVKGSGNTTNLKFHLERSHPKLEMVVSASKDKCTSGLKRKHTPLSENEEDDVVPIMEYFEESVPSPALSTTSTTSIPSTSFTTSPTPRKQGRLDIGFCKQKSFQDGGSKAACITNKLLFMIAKDNLSFHTVEKEGFIAFMKTIAPMYKLPSRKSVTTLMKEKYEALSNIIKNQFSAIEHLSLTTDIWTDTLNVKSFLGVTSHFIFNNKHKSITVGVTELDERHTSQYLETWLIKIVEDWKINKDSIVVVVSDSGANIKKAIKDAFGVDKHLSCFAHTLNLVPSTILESDNNVNSVRKKVKTIITYFKKSVVAADKLRSVSDLKLIQSVDTRWNSMYHMLTRFIQLSDKVGLILLQCHTAPAMLSALELQIIKEFVELLKPFEDATKIMSGESYLTSRKVIPIINTLRTTLQSLQPESKIGIRLQQLLIEQFRKRFDCIEQVSVLAVATILDPRFKRIHFCDKVACSHAINKITKSVNNRPLTDLPKETENTKIAQKTNFWSYHKDLVNLNKSKKLTTIRTKCQKS